MRKAGNLLIILCITSFAVLLTGCASNSKTDSLSVSSTSSGSLSDNSSEQSTNQISNGNKNDSTTTSDIQENDIEIKTIYGSLYFPGQWQKYLKTEQTNKNETVEVTFTADINNESFPLFTITIGNGEGNPAGTITGSDGVKRNVFVHIEDISESDSLNKDEQRQLYVMQEDINYLLDNLK